MVNASPLILLGKVGQVVLLRDLSNELIIPEAVAQEVGEKPDGEKVLGVVAALSTAQIGGAVTVPREVELWDLGRGESAVLTQAAAGPESRAVVDDLEARRCAQTLEVPVIGTLGVVLRAKRRGLITAARPVVTNLREAGLYLSDALVERALAHLEE